MTNSLNLTQDFPAVDYQAWRALVEQTLKGADFDKKLTTRLYDGITLQPLYTKADWDAQGDPSGFPGFAPFARGGTAANGVQGWDIRQVFLNPDLKKTNREILNDLERGVTSVLLRLDAAGRAGLDPESELAGVDGVMIATADDLDSALGGVMLEICPVTLDAGAGAPAAAALLAEVWRKRGIKGAEAVGAFNIDPLGTLAEQGSLPTSLDAALTRMAEIAAHTSNTWPNVTAVGVDAGPYSDAGASDVEDLACAMATAVAYLRAMTAAGMSIDAACRQISFSIPVGTDFFLGIAKLRAARMLWARVAEACGAAEDSRSAALHATTASRVVSQRDPWVNILRVTVASFAAGVAGADSVTALPFDAALGLPSDLARRIARNTQIILQEESNLTRVIDPAGGSWYVETLTRQVAERAWAEFQAIEAEGGMAAALTSGSLAARLDKSWQARRAAVAKRKDALTGINEFPNLTEKPVECEQPDLAALRKGAVARLANVRRGGSVGAIGTLFDLARDGTLGGLTAALSDGGKASITALPAHRLGEEFEALRDASDRWLAANGSRPKVFLANMGKVAQHTGRATFARNFFEAGGIEAITTDGFDDAATMAAAFKASGASVACICGTDAQYDESAEAFAKTLKETGASRVVLAGRAGDKQAAYDAAGVDDYIYVGCDVLGLLQALHARLGVK
ncbi:MAG: methylmalonyl-CoA mutase family protein [Rhodospirillaceae bacterium]